MARVITVTALNRYVRTLLESDAVLTDIALRGEVQNFVHHRSGHFYFSLKDENCSVKAVMFRSNAARLSFEPQNGMAVVVRCRISLYERDGAFQVYVEDLFPDGQGAAQMAFEQLKQRLAAEGLFSPERKRPIPPFPAQIGLVTSKSGAALQDILAVARRRWPAARFLLAHAGVQGQGAEAELVSALQRLDRCGADVIVIARGGGSKEDLWVFNSEALARAVCSCRTPVVSAVGHEVDYTILDFVADLRAATPTAAAELLLPDQQAVRSRLDQLQATATTLVLQRLQMCYNEYKHIAAAFTPACLVKKVDVRARQLEELTRRLSEAAGEMLAKREGRLTAAARLLDSLSPHRTLARGYCVARRGRQTVCRRGQLRPGDSLRLFFSDFSADCQVQQLLDKGAGDEEETEL